MLLTNLALGTLMISLTVVIHTFGLMGVTHVMAWVTDRIRLHGHRSRLLAMNTVVIGVFAVLTAEVWLWAAAYSLLGVVDDFETALSTSRPRPFPPSVSATWSRIRNGACWQLSKVSTASC